MINFGAECLSPISFQPNGPVLMLEKATEDLVDFFWLRRSTGVTIVFPSPDST